MKAIVYTKYGQPDVLHLEEVEKPTPKANEVLVKVHAASINDWDWQLLQGIPFINRLMAGILKPTRIKILGCDIAGKVEAVGKNVKQFHAEDEVFGDRSGCGFGGFAEYVCARENSLTPKSASMTFEQAASLPQAGLLALQGFRKKSEIQPGQKVLINGASGGVGTLAVQMAKSYEAEVTGVCSTGKIDMVYSFGADHVIDYTQDDFTKNGLCYDLILDVMGYHSIFDYKRSLSPKGVYVMIGGSSGLANQIIFFGPWISMIGNKKMSLLLYKPNKGLDILTGLVETGKVTPVIDRTYKLRESADAFRYYGEGHAKGKIVITVEHNDKT